MRGARSRCVCGLFGDVSDVIIRRIFTPLYCIQMRHAAMDVIGLHTDLPALRMTSEPARLYNITLVSSLQIDTHKKRPTRTTIYVNTVTRMYGTMVNVYVT